MGVSAGGEAADANRRQKDGDKDNRTLQSVTLATRVVTPAAIFTRTSLANI